MPPPTLQGLLDAAEENFRSQRIEEAIKQANMARNYIDQFLTAYHIHMASQRKIDGVPDWYAVLGIQDSNNADIDAEAIKNAFKKLVLKVHPDKNSSAAADGAFKLVSKALDVLKEPSSRQEYDRLRGSSTSSNHHHSSNTNTNASEQVSPNSGQPAQSSSASQHQYTFYKGTPTATAAGSTSWSYPIYFGSFSAPDSWMSGSRGLYPNSVAPIFTGGGYYQAPPPHTTGDGRSSRAAERIRRSESWNQYGHGPSNVGATDWTAGASASSSQVRPPIQEALKTGLCPNCKTLLNSIPFGSGSFTLSCRRCFWSLVL